MNSIIKFSRHNGVQEDGRTSTIPLIPDSGRRYHLGCNLFAGIDRDRTGIVGLAGGAHCRVFLAAFLFSRFTLFNLKHPGHYLVLVLVLVLVGITAPNLFYYNAAPHLSAGILAITISTLPLFTYAIMLVLRFESIVLRRMAGILLGMIAILLLVVPDHGFSNDDANLWILLVIVCALLYAVENVYIGRGVAPSIDIRELLFGSNLVAALIQFPLAMYLGVDEPWRWLASDAGLAVTGIALGSGFAYAMFFTLSRRPDLLLRANVPTRSRFKA
jgi:drug/metabolite transporter (DMT)-like permease